MQTRTITLTFDPPLGDGTGWSEREVTIELNDYGWLRGATIDGPSFIMGLHALFSGLEPMAQGSLEGIGADADTLD